MALALLRRELPRALARGATRAASRRQLYACLRAPHADAGARGATAFYAFSMYIRRETNAKNLDFS